MVVLPCLLHAQLASQAAAVQGEPTCSIVNEPVGKHAELPSDIDPQRIIVPSLYLQTLTIQAAVTLGTMKIWLLQVLKFGARLQALAPAGILYSESPASRS